MVNTNDYFCPVCGGDLYYYDSVSRIVRTKGKETRHVRVRRLRCATCKTLHRELPDFIFPYKQYEAELIKGVIEGLITSDTLGYEDYPCEMTMKRWGSQNFHVLL